MKKEYYVFAVLVLLLLLVFGFENYLRQYRYGDMHGNAGGMMGGVYSMMQGSGMMNQGAFGMGWSFLLFLVLLLVLVAYLLVKGKETPVENDSAAAILRERYARGEITRDEYLQMFKDLKEKK